MQREPILLFFISPHNWGHLWPAPCSSGQSHNLQFFYLAQFLRVQAAREDAQEFERPSRTYRMYARCVEYRFPCEEGIPFGRQGSVYVCTSLDTAFTFTHSSQEITAGPFVRRAHGRHRADCTRMRATRVLPPLLRSPLELGITSLAFEGCIPRKKVVFAKKKKRTYWQLS